MLDVVRARHPGADVHRLPHVDVAVFTDGPERDVFNNAVLAHGLGAQERRDAVDALVTTYADAGITSYAAWVHETDTAMLAELTGRGFVHQETTWAMGRSLDSETGASHADVDAGTWAEYLRVLELPPGLLERADPGDFHLALGRLDGDPVATGMAFDHDGDAGVYNVGTLDRARRRGLGSAVVGVLLRDARGPGSAYGDPAVDRDGPGGVRPPGLPRPGPDPRAGSATCPAVGRQRRVG